MMKMQKTTIRKETSEYQSPTASLNPKPKPASNQALGCGIVVITFRVYSTCRLVAKGIYE